MIIHFYKLDKWLNHIKSVVEGAFLVKKIILLAYILIPLPLSYPV